MNSENNTGLIELSINSLTQISGGDIPYDVPPSGF